MLPLECINRNPGTWKQGFCGWSLLCRRVFLLLNKFRLKGVIRTRLPNDVISLCHV